MTEIDPEVVELYTYLVEQLSELGILYIHMVEPRLADGDGTDPTKFETSWTNDPFRKIFKGEDGRMKEKALPLLPVLPEFRSSGWGGGKAKKSTRMVPVQQTRVRRIWR